ncbi:MAG TPA: 4-alpha-glucanotransferase [Mycobacteriales bacterium]|nr:4-alpha-glucanotransferase [Mycobacteriales bacterium]HWA68010.1 4-alpha-glucanotransferase [Mycobacteriales bacterium]
MSAATTRRELRELAKLSGVQLRYTGNDGKPVTASVESLAGALTALGHAVGDAAAISASLAAARHRRQTQLLEPVIVRRPDGSLSSALPESGLVEIDGARVDPSSPGLTTGYHRLTVTLPRRSEQALLLVPPSKRRAPTRQLVVNAPVYALRGHHDWGIGSYADLAQLAELAQRWGAGLAGTLPLFATFTRTPIDPSPYVPVSRMFWNELYVDVPSAARLAGADRATEVTQARPPTKVRAGERVDYEKVARAKRRALQACAAAIHSTGGARRDDFERFLADHPELGRYAEFRSAHEHTGTGWRRWASPPGAVPDGSVDPEAAQYYRFVQYAASTQLAAIADGPAAGLYLDLPVGVHPDGFDTWSHPELFADAEVGAPPDALAADGQAWGFPPLHPEELRRCGYSYFIAALRQVLRFARAIRLDHILGLQRLYWIPAGADARSGVYVRYAEEELLAIVAIEADRAGATIVGEDLGTVSPTIRRAMDRGGILHSFVYQFEASAKTPLPQPRQPSAASLGSHDLPRFAAYWSDPAQRDLVAAVGETEPARALAVCLDSLTEGPADYLLVDVADLEGETEPDNRPGTGPEAGNWRRRLPRTIDELADDDGLHRLMKGLTAARPAEDRRGTDEEVSVP